MKVEQWKIEDIIPYENNPRVNDQAVDKTAMSIKEYGWQQPIVVDKKGVEYFLKKCRDNKYYYKKIGSNTIFWIANCQECGILYMANLYNFNRSGKLFCSLSCSTAFKNKTIEHKRKVSAGLKRLVAKGNYLSNEHIKKMRRGSAKYYKNNEKKVRATLIRASAISMKTVRSGRHYRGHFYETGWNKKSKELRKKIPYCQFCGSQKFLQVHHIIPFKYEKNNSLSNLIVLCARCHKKVEYEVNGILDKGQDFNFQRGLLKCLYEDRKAIIRGAILEAREGSVK